MKKKLSALLALILFIGSIPFTSCFKKTDEFDEQNIVLSFSAMSDIHQEMGMDWVEDKLVKALDYSKELNGKDLDAVVFAGDLTESTWRRKEEEDYSLTYNADVAVFKSALERSIDKNKTHLFYAFGNHDTDSDLVGDAWASQIPTLFYNQLGEEYFRADTKDSNIAEGFRHAVINGYHFLSVNPNLYWTTQGFKQKHINWLDERLYEITQKDPDKYVFIVGHVPLYDTTFGSSTPQWYDLQVKKVLKNYPQAIYFSGHLHNVLQDEANISQNGQFTALDCGAVKYSTAMNRVYSDKFFTVNFNNEVSTDGADFSQGLLVQADRSGNIKVTRCDYINERKIKDAWYLSYPKEDKSHLLSYDDDLRKRNTLAPYFESEATIEKESTSSGVRVTWSAAKDDDMVRYYELRLLKEENGEKTEAGNYLISSHIYLYDKKENMPTELSYTIQGEFSGEYTLEIKAVDCFEKKSSVLSKTFSV